jgi:DNA-binding CsgD family transcriptional regulator
LFDIAFGEGMDTDSTAVEIHTADKLVVDFYRSAGDEDWQGFRTRALTRLSQVLRLDAAAWWSRGRRGGDGELTQVPRVVVTLDELRTIMPRSKLHAAIVRVDPSAQTWLFHYPHLDGRLLSTLLLRFQTSVREPDVETLQRLCMHMVEATGIALKFYLRRDEWLDSMGRPSRGSGALVDSSGTIYYASDRFYELLGSENAQPCEALPFALPDSVLDGTERSFIHGPLHFRVSPVGQLYLLHARRPLPLDQLSPREQEIARALGNGKTFKSVARQYGIAVSTVANHASRIYRKLAIYRREDLVALLREPGQGSQAREKAAAKAAG